MPVEKEEHKYKVVSINRKAKHEYHILEVFEAGLVLKGTEVKSIRDNQVSIKESYAQLKGSELYIINMHIAPYKYGNRFNLEPKRDRKLLLNKRELNKIRNSIESKGITVVPLRLYFKNGFAKLEIALAKGKKLFDKKRELTQRAIDREAEREFKDKKGGR